MDGWMMSRWMYGWMDNEKIVMSRWMDGWIKRRW